jgi:Mg2+ and Co2+ transporter CorA
MRAPAPAQEESGLRAILYDAAGHDRDVRVEDVDIETLARDQLLWVDVAGRIPQNLPARMRSALRSSEELGSLEIFDEYYRFAIPLRDSRGMSLRFAVGPSWVLTSSDSRPAFFDDFVKADQGETLKGRMTATAFMASLLMRYLDGFREEIAGVDRAIDKLDDLILRSREKQSPLAALAALRRRLSGLRAVLTEQRTIIHGLVAPDFLAHVSEADREFLVEVNRVYERLEDDIGRARETVIGSFELYASRVAQDTNQLLKVLTIATVITGIIGAVAGIFGMNFDTPIPHSGLQGFLVVTGAMVGASIGIVALAIWRRWV